MIHQGTGTVAALQFSERPALDFADIVEEFDIAFQTGAVQRRLTWDCDDVAIFDRETIRVALGWMQPERAGQPWYLILAVGSSPDAPQAPLTREFCEELATHILMRTQSYLPYDAVYRSETGQPVDAALIDTVTAQLLQASTQAATNIRANKTSEAPANGVGHSGLQEAATSGANSWYTPLLKNFRSGEARRHARATFGAGAQTETEEMKKLREAICGASKEEDITLPMHLSIYALGATMLIQVPPVGAALLVYTVLREDFRAAA